jgi:hypothetical protein
VVPVSFFFQLPDVDTTISGHYTTPTEVDPNQPTQSLPLTDLTSTVGISLLPVLSDAVDQVIYGIQTGVTATTTGSGVPFQASVGSLPFGEYPPPVSSDPSESFIADFFGLPAFPYLSVAAYGMSLVVVTGGTRQVFIAATNADEPKLPTGKTLSWKDYKVVKKAEFGAFTGVKIKRNPDTDITTISSPDGSRFVGTAVMDVKFRVEFVSADSYVLAGRQTKALLEHKRTHLLIAEYVAHKATLNLPDSFKGAQAKGDTAREAEANAKADLLKVLDTKLEEAQRILAAVTLLYDTETRHGLNMDAQLDWEQNYIDKIDAYVKKKYMWDK